jgi:hypothetical protein
MLAFSGPWISEPDRAGFLAGLTAIPLGWHILKAARNLRKIRISDHSIRVLPVDVSLNIADLKTWSVPSFVERRDTPANSFSQVTFETVQAQRRWITGIPSQSRDTCVVNIGGSGADKVLEALAASVPRKFA